jgi:hypothetical protein
MNKVLYERVGFGRPLRHERPLTPRKIAFARLITTVALVMSIAVAATAVTFNIARADDLGGATAYQGPIAAVVVIGGALAVMGIVTVALSGSHARRSD